MDSCGCGDDFASIFDRGTAERDRERYRRHGPDETTAMLLEMINRDRVRDASVLDIGGGIGVITQELLKAGAGHAVLVDAAPAYLEVARNEFRASNALDRVDIVEGDFVRRASSIDTSDIVTLDRVVCCYPDAESLVRLSADRARNLLGLVLPRNTRLVRLALWANNLRFRLTRSPYRAFGHSNELIDRLVGDLGLDPIAEERTLFWRVVLYRRGRVRPSERFLGSHQNRRRS
jgi:magnesium-protoporphyrin O-methyltransferase